MRRAGDVSALIAIPAVHGDRRCLARASTGGTRKQNCKNRRLTSRGSPFCVNSMWVAGEARAKLYVCIPDFFCLALSLVGILLQYFGEKFGRRSERLANLPWNYIRSAMILGIGLIYLARLITDSPPSL